MAQYIPYFGTQQGPPPYSFPGVSIYAFVLPADIGALEMFCNTFLSVDPRRVFTPLAPFVLLGISQYPKMISENDASRGLGYTSQNEYYFMFPAVRHDAIAGNFLVPREITWVCPYIGVDNSTSAAAGREMLGFPKMVGDIGLDTARDGVFSATVAMPGFQVFSPDSAQELLPLISIRTGATLRQSQAGQHAFPWDLLALGADLDEQVIGLLGGASPDSYSVTNLKQFCDPAQPDLAVYQALVRAVWTQSNTGPTTFYDGALIEVFDNVTMRIVEHLGLTQGLGPKLNPLLAVSQTTDMVFGNVTNRYVSR